jgi:hypothetical protein
VLSGVARHIPAEDDEESGGKSASLDTVVDKVAESPLGAEVAEDDTVKELALKGF